MAPHEIEAELSRAAAVAMLADRAPAAERSKAIATLAWLDLVANPHHRRAAALRVIPLRHTARPPSWARIATMLAINAQTARSWHAAALAQIAAQLPSPAP
jgi:hypothetical protein